MTEEFGACVFDVTLDCEDGAPAGAEVEQAHLVVALANSGYSRSAGIKPRIGARLHPVDHAFLSPMRPLLWVAQRSLWLTS